MRSRRTKNQLRPLANSLSRFKSLVGIAAAMGFASGHPARGQIATWDNGSGDLLWSNALNWFADTLPLATDQVIFGTAGSAGVVQLDGARVVDSLVFDLPGFTLSDVVQQNLTVSSGNISVSAGVAAAIDSILVGTNGLTLVGGGSLTLGSANNFSGQTTVTNGALRFTNVGALSTGDVVVSAAGTLVSDVNFAPQDLGNNVLLNGGTFSQTQAQQLNFAAGKSLTIGAAGGIVDVSGAAGAASKIFLATGQLGGDGTFTKTGAGTFQLNGANFGFTGNALVTGGFLEAQDSQALGATPGTVTVSGTGEFVMSNLTWSGGIIAETGGAISGDNGNSTVTGAITATGDFAARARDFYATDNGRTLTLAGAISGSGGLIAQGPTSGTGRVLITGNNTAWAGGLQVDPNAQAVVSVGFGAGATTSLPSGDLTLNGGRLTITPSIGTDLITTPGLVGRWITTGNTTINATFTTPWFTLPTAATRTDAVIDFPNMAGIQTATGLPGGPGGVPQGVGISATTAFVDRYAVIYNGLFNITLPGDYTFYLPGDDGTALFIDGQQVISNETATDGTVGHGLPGPGATSLSVALSSGLHQVTVKNTNGGTGGGLQLAYQGPDQLVFPNALNPIPNMAEVALTSLSNVTGGLNYTLANNIVVPNQAFATNTILETSGFDTISTGSINVGTNGNLIFASATSHAFTSTGVIALAEGAGLSSAGVPGTTVPMTTVLTPANVTINGNIALLGNANLNATGGPSVNAATGVATAAHGLLTVNGVIDDGAGSFGITMNGTSGVGGGQVVLGGTLPNAFDGAFTVKQGLLLLNKPAGVNAIGAGGLSVDATGLAAVPAVTAGVNVAVARLMANEQIADAAPLIVSSHLSSSYGVTFDLNGFTETVGSLSVTGATVNMGRVVMGLDGRLIVNGDISMSGMRNATGNTGREALITGVASASTALNLFQPGTGTLDLGGGTRNINVTTTVTQLNTDGTIDSVIVNGGIAKIGGQRLVLNGSDPTTGRHSTFAGGITLDDGILRGGGRGGQVSSVFGTGPLTINKGITTASGGIVDGAAILELRNNSAAVNTIQAGTLGANFVGQSVANVVNYGNAVTVAGFVPVFGVDVNNYPQLQNGATLTGSGAELRLGTLTTGGPLQLNVTGGNNYALGFGGLALGGPLTVNAIGANLRLNNLSGLQDISTILGSTGNVIIGGNGATFGGVVSVAAGGTLRLAPSVGVANNLFGTGSFTTAANPTIGISPTLEGGSLTAGTPGGLTGRFYQTGAAQALNTTATFASVPSGVTPQSLLNDATMVNRPPGVTNTSFTNGIAVYTGLLNITTAGEYTFQTFVDDQSQLVIDGAPLISVNTGGGGTPAIYSPVSGVVTLAAGLHTITFKVANNGSGGGGGVLYNGPDSGGVMRSIPSAALQSIAPLTNVANSGIDQTIAGGGSLTLDGGGTDLDGGINNLTFGGATGTLTVTNAGGVGTITVSGTTSLSPGTTTLNPTTGVLGLLGDVSGTGAITKTGAGLLIFSGAKTFTGQLNINAGGVQITDPQSLGTPAGGTVVASGAVLDLNGVALAGEPITLSGTGVASISPAALWNSSQNAASSSGAFTLAAATTIGGLGDITLSGTQSGNFALTKIGPNTVTLAGLSTNTAAITVSAGILKVGHTDALGTTAGTTTVSAGAALDLNGISLGEPLSLTGTGRVGFGSGHTLGALINTGAAATQTGGITLAGATTIGSSSLAPGGNITIAATIAGAQNLTKVGGNTLTLTAASTAPNAMIVNFGNVVLSGAGTMTGGTWTINPTATVTLDNEVAGNINSRLGPRAINLVGGNLNIIGNASAATTESMAATVMTVNSGNGVVTLTPSAGFGTSLASTAALTRANNGTVLLRGTNLGASPGANVGTLLFSSVQSIGQQGGPGTKNRGILPWGLADQSATGSGTSFVAHAPGSGIQVLNPLFEYDVDTITGSNNILFTAPFDAPSGTTFVNSLTFNGGSLNLAAPDVLHIESGGILASASAVIDGGTINVGIAQSQNLRELVLMTPGTGTVLTVSSVLTSAIPGVNSFGPRAAQHLASVINRMGLVKAGDGIAVLGAQNSFAGTTRLNAGTTVLAGGDNTILFPTTSAPVLGATGSTLNSANLVVNAGATLDLNGTRQRFGGFASNLTAGTTALPGQGGVITNNSTTSDATIYFSQGATFTVPTSINASGEAGARPLHVQRDGGFTMTLTAPHTYTGTTVLNGGVTALIDGATLSGTSSIQVNRAVLNLDDSQTFQTLNRIPVTTPLTLKGGALGFIGRGGGTQNEHALGTVTIASGGASLIQQTMAGATNANSSGSSKLTIGNLARGGVAAQVTFRSVLSNNHVVGENPYTYLSQLNGGPLPAPGVMLPAWITLQAFNPASAAGGTSGSIGNIVAASLDFAQHDPATGLRPVFYTSSIAPGNNVNLTATTTLPVGGAVINSLRLDGASTLIFGNAGYDVLNLQSGGLISPNNANNRSIGNAINAGNLTAGGVNPNAPQELFVYNAANTLTINARIINNPTDGSVVSPVFSAASHNATITLTGSNAYTGTTYVNGVNLNLNNTVGGFSIPGNLIAGGGTSNGTDSQNPANQTITLTSSSQIAPTATVTLNGGTVLSLGANFQTLANLVFATDGGSFNNQGPVVQTGTGLLTLTGGVSATTLNQATTIPLMQGNLSLPDGAHPFEVGLVTAAPGQIGLALNSNLSGNGSIEKNGPGILGIGGASTLAYTGTLNINDGSVQFSSNNASLGGGTVNIPAGKILNAGGFVGAVGALTGTGTVTSTFGGLASHEGRVDVGVNNFNSTFGGLVTGVVGMGKVGTGDFSLTNPNNDYTGGTFVFGGTFTLAGAGVNTTGQGGVTVNAGGTLAGAGLIAGNLQFKAGSAVTFDLSAAGGSAPIEAPQVSVSGPVSVSITGSPAPGTYPLIDYNAAPLTAGQMAGLKVGATPPGVLLYGLVNNGANSLIDLVVETVKPLQTWTGAVDGVWDTATNNWTGTYTDGNQVLFNDTAANRVITGGAVRPQAITVNNSAAADPASNAYTIENPIGGALAGGLLKSGTGTLRLTGANTFTGGITIDEGTLRASVSSASNSLGSGSVSLGDGATLQLDPVANTSAPGITGRYFHQPTNGNTLGNVNYEVPAIATQTDVAGGVFNLTWNTANRPVGGLVGLNGGTAWESFAAQWVGKLNITAAGPYSIFTSTDDASRVFIDGVQIHNNDGGKGTLEGGYPTFLEIGLHDVRVEYTQGTGGATARFSWQGPGIPKGDVPASALFAAENVANGFADNHILAGTNVSVAGNATIALAGRNFTGVQLGGLTLPADSVLNVPGNTGKQLRAAATYLSGGIVALNASADLNLGQVTDGGIPSTLIKQGPGRLFFDNTSPVNTGDANVLSAGTVIEVQGGTLALKGINAASAPLGSTNPLDSASVRLNGGSLSLETKHGTVGFNNAISVLQNARIEQQASSNLAITLGSAANGISMSNGSTLTFDLFGGTRGTTNAGAQNANQLSGGANLIVAAPIAGVGDLVFRSTHTNMSQYAVYASATLNANNTVSGTTTLNGGFGFQNVTNPLVVTLNGQGRLSGSTGITINAAQLTVDDSATVNTGRIAFGAPLTLRAGTLHMLASTTANSGETFGPLTLGAGWNRIIQQNSPGTNFVNGITADSLTRNNRAAVQFQGNALGNATTATQVRFNIAPDLRGGGGAAATSTISVVPFAVGATNPGTNPPTFFPVTYDFATGIRPISAANETVTVVGAVADANARNVIGAATTLVPGTNGINTFTAANSSNAAQTMTLGTNPLLFSGTGAGLLLMTTTNSTQSALTITGTPINFQDAEGHIIVTSTAGGTIASEIQGANGLTVSGNNNINTNNLQQLSGGSLTLTGNNTFTGAVTINGRLVMNNGTSDAPLGNPANPVQFGGGTLVFANAGTTLSSTRIVSMLPDSFGVLDTNGNVQTIAGPVVGAGGLVKIGAGTLQLTDESNSYGGTTTVFQGNLVTNTGPQGDLVLRGTAAGNANTAISNATFQQGASGTYLGNISGIGSVTFNNISANPITIRLGDANDPAKGVNSYSGGTTFASSNLVTLQGTTSSLVGGIVTQASHSIVYEQNFDGTASSVISGPASVAKAGTGTVTVVNDHAYSGITDIRGGTLSISSAANLGNGAGTNTIALSNGATLQVTATLDLGTNRTIELNNGGGFIDVPNPADHLTVSGVVIGAATDSFTKTGAGTVTLSTTNGYTGVTNINAGTLAILVPDGVATSAEVHVAAGANFDVSATFSGVEVGLGKLLVNDGVVTGNVVAAGTVGGSGVITGDLSVLITGVVNPGSSPGDLTVEGLTTFDPGTTFALDLDGGAPGIAYDQLTIGTNGAIAINGGNVTLSLGFAPAQLQSFTIIDNLALGPIMGQFDNLPDGGSISAVFNGITYNLTADYQGGDGNDLVLTVPEPGAIALVLGGLGLLCARRRRSGAR